MSKVQCLNKRKSLTKGEGVKALFLYFVHCLGDYDKDLLGGMISGLIRRGSGGLTKNDQRFPFILDVELCTFSLRKTDKISSIPYMSRNNDFLQMVLVTKWART